MKVPLERLLSEPPITGPDATAIRWHPDGMTCTYLQSSGKDAPGDLWSYQLESGARALLVEGADLKAADPDAKLTAYEWLPDGTSILLAAGGKAWTYHLAAKRLDPLLSGIDEQVFPHLSPSGTRLAFVRDGNLWIRELPAGEERALTFDGGEAVLNGKLDWVYWEELAHRKSWRAFEWSPNGEYLAFLRLDQERVPHYPLVDAREVQPKLTRQRYPKAGDPNALPSVHIIAVAGGAPRVSVELPDDSSYVAPELAWSPEGMSVAWTCLERSQQALQLRTLSADGHEEVVLKEADPFWLNRIGPPHFLPDGSFLWLSERSGFSHLYHYTAQGKLLRQLTDGPWQVEEIHGQAGEHVVLTGTGIDPRSRLLYRVPVLGGEVEALTPDGCCAGTEWRKGGGAAVVHLSTPEGPGRKLLSRGTDEPGRPFWTPAPEWEQYHWAGSEYHDVTTSDGTLLHGRLIKPPHFDPAERYPVVVHVYGGPHAQNVRYTWAGADPLDQLLAQEGVLVWRLDNRGTWGRGHLFETRVNRRLYVRELADQLEGVEFLKSLPFVDPERIGITGWSYGGSMTLYALTRAPEVWRCGAAGAPVTDWALYDSIYTERYMGTPQENPDGYREVSILDGAPHLRAPLLLIHGTDDDNVHLQNTLQFVDRLSQHRKPYELLLQPGQKHGFTGQSARTYLHERLLEFFLRHL